MSRPIDYLPADNQIIVCYNRIVTGENEDNGIAHSKRPTGMDMIIEKVKELMAVRKAAKGKTRINTDQLIIRAKRWTSKK